jgi:PAS domain S-box-containing protein
MATGHAADVETQAVLDDGTRIHVRNRAVPFFSQDGQLKGFIEMIENIDERKKTEEALKKSEERFENVTGNSGDWIWEVNVEGLYTYSSPVVKKVLGYEPEEIVGKKHFYDFFAPDLKEDLKKTAFEAFANKKCFRSFTNPNVHKDGSIVYLETSGTPIIDETGNLCGYQGADRDISEREKTEQRKAQLLEQLEKANEELKSFGYIVSHDLKAPLRGVKVLADWIYEDYIDKIDEEGKQKMNLLVSRVDRMHNLIDGIMQYSKIGRLEEEKSHVNLGELMPDIIDMVSPPENIEIIIENELPIIECGRIRIAQVFQNLLSNAIKYMDKPQGLIKICCEENRDFWKFSVKDNGPGIAEEYFEKIFQMYQTLEPQDNYESTGVGLTVVKKIVDLYGGKIWVESQEGQGSTFIFTIPKPQEQKERIENEKLQTNSIS